MVFRDKYGRFVKGNIPWNKGKTGVYSNEVLKIMSKAKIGRHVSPHTEFKKGHVPWNKGMKGLYINGSEKGWFKKGHKWPEKIKKKMLKKLLEKTLLKPNLNMTENLSYIVGLLKGDGCVYKNGRCYWICFDNTNKNLSRNIFRALEEIGLNPTLYGVRPSNGIGKLKQYRVVANSKLFYNWYKGLSAKKLRELLDTKEKIVSFIRGFYEAEGGIYKSKNGTISVAMYNTDLELLKLIKSLLEKLGLHFRLNGPYKNIKLGGPSARPIYRLITSSKKNVNTFLNLIKPSVKNLQ